MNTDAKINWFAGMEITPQTFINLENIMFEQRMIIRKILSCNIFGLIPKTKFEIDCDIDDNVLNIKYLNCQVLLFSGQVIQIDSKNTISFPIMMKNEKSIYFTIEIGGEDNELLKNDMKFLSNSYKFDFKTLSELKKFKNAMPILKIMEDKGRCSVNRNYMAPVIAIRTSPLFIEKLAETEKLISKIVEHENFNKIANSLNFAILSDELSDFSVDDSPRNFYVLCRKIARTIGIIMDMEKFNIPEYNLYDPSFWLDEFCLIFENSCSYMDSLTKVEPIIEEKIIEEKIPEEEKIEIIDEFIPMI